MYILLKVGEFYPKEVKFLIASSHASPVQNLQGH